MNHRIAFVLIAACGCNTLAAAAAQPTPAAARNNCVELKTTAEQQITTVVDGKTVRQTVVAAKVVPGDEVTWTTTARNLCDLPVESVVINQPVAEHMNYIGESAVGAGSQITFSLDGREYLPAAQLRVRDSDGTARPARADEIRSVRWTLSTPIAPKSVATVSYRAVLK